MATQYNHIAEQYKRSKHVIWRYYIEQYSLLELLGDVSGKSVLDLACGEGHYTRLLKTIGASRVVGVDLSSKMIELAEESEREQPLGIEYVVADARNIQFQEGFDFVVAAYLLNYARSEDELLAMCQAISRSLKPGGRFVTINNNPMQHVSHFGATRKYGFIKTAEGDIRNGTPIRYRFFLDSDTFDLENYHLDAATHVWALREAGLSDIQWHMAKLSPDEAMSPTHEYWRDFLQDPPITLLRCSK
jgi:ubiquinone/menaquinone biosynthesis C-methylase UbiE